MGLKSPGVLITAPSPLSYTHTQISKTYPIVHKNQVISVPDDTNTSGPITYSFDQYDYGYSELLSAPEGVFAFTNNTLYKFNDTSNKFEMSTMLDGSVIFAPNVDYRNDPYIIEYSGQNTLDDFITYYTELNGEIPSGGIDAGVDLIGIVNGGALYSALWCDVTQMSVTDIIVDGEWVDYDVRIGPRMMDSNLYFQYYWLKLGETYEVQGPGYVTYSFTQTAAIPLHAHCAMVTSVVVYNPSGIDDFSAYPQSAPSLPSVNEPGILVYTAQESSYDSNGVISVDTNLFIPFRELTNIQNGNIDNYEFIPYISTSFIYDPENLITYWSLMSQGVQGNTTCEPNNISRFNIRNYYDAVHDVFVDFTNLPEYAPITYFMNNPPAIYNSSSLILKSKPYSLILDTPYGYDNANFERPVSTGIDSYRNENVYSNTIDKNTLRITNPEYANFIKLNSWFTTYSFYGTCVISTVNNGDSKGYAVNLIKFNSTFTSELDSKLVDLTGIYFKSCMNVNQLHPNYISHATGIRASNAKTFHYNTDGTYDLWFNIVDFYNKPRTIKVTDVWNNLIFNSLTGFWNINESAIQEFIYPNPPYWKYLSYWKSGTISWVE